MANLSGKELNAIEDRIVQRFKKMEDDLVASLLADGPPYGSEILSGRELYDNLVEMRASGDPGYYEDPRAAEMLAKLSEQYGPPPPITPPFMSPLGGLVQL